MSIAQTIELWLSLYALGKFSLLLEKIYRSHCLRGQYLP